jgi:hypothetical protein
VRWLWLAIVIYSWVGPVIFKRMLDKELQQLRLDPNF